MFFRSVWIVKTIFLILKIKIVAEHFLMVSTMISFGTNSYILNLLKMIMALNLSHCVKKHKSRLKYEILEEGVIDER